MKRKLEEEVETCPYINRCNLYYQGCEECLNRQWYEECWNYRSKKERKEKEVKGVLNGIQIA